jgi:membrane protease YdiL (CAAX protease family)
MTRDPHDWAFSEPPEPGEPAPQSIPTEASGDGAVPEGANAAAAPPDGPVVFLSAAANEPPPDYLRDDLPPDARVPWGWLDVVLLAILAIGATFLFGIAIVVVLVSLGVSMSHLRDSPSYEGMVAVVAQILADIFLMVFLALQARWRFRAPFWRTLGWRRLETGEIPRGVAYGGFVFLGFVLAVMVTVLDSMFPSKAPLPIQALLEDHRTALLFMLTAVLVAPLVEETIFRGYLYPVCVRSFGMGGGILVTGTVFGLLHSVQLWGGWWQIAFLVLVGIVLTTARAMTGTVVASYIVHVSYNALPVFAYLVGTYGRHATPVLH